MKAYILTISEPPRNASLVQECSSVGIWAELIKGVKGKDLKEDSLASANEYSNALYGRTLSLPELGCAMGHKKILERVVKSDSEWALILEDDVSLRYWPSNLLAEICLLDPTAHVISLRHQDVGPLYVKRAWEKYYPMLPLVRPPWGTSSFLVNRKAAQILLESYNLEKIGFVADWPPTAISQINFWIYAIKTFEESGSASTIQNFRANQLSNQNPHLHFQNLGRNILAKIIRLYRLNKFGINGSTAILLVLNPSLHNFLHRGVPWKKFQAKVISKQLRLIHKSGPITISPE